MEQVVRDQKRVENHWLGWLPVLCVDILQRNSEHRSSKMCSAVLMNCFNEFFDWPKLWQTGFPRGIEGIEKVLHFKIHFQDLEKVGIEKVWKF